MGGMGNNNRNEVRMRRHGAHGAAPAVTMSVQRCSAAVCIPGPHSAETSCTPLQAAQGGYSAELVIWLGTDLHQHLSQFIVQNIKFYGRNTQFVDYLIDILDR